MTAQAKPLVNLKLGAGHEQHMPRFAAVSETQSAGREMVCASADNEDRHFVVIETVLSYEGMGMPEFPVNVRTKRPKRKGWQRVATDDWLAMIRLFANFPDANVGLLMGGEIGPGEYCSRSMWT